MESLQIKVNKKIYDKVLWLLSQFNPEDLVIVTDSVNKIYLQEQLATIDKGNGNFVSIEELDAMLEERIKKHEN